MGRNACNWSDCTYNNKSKLRLHHGLDTAYKPRTKYCVSWFGTWFLRIYFIPAIRFIDTQTYEENEYDLHRVVISTGYYGSCSVCHSSFSTYNANIQRNSSRLDERTPLLPAYAPARTWRFINIRIFSLGILFIGGVFIGSYLLYKQGMDSFDVSIMECSCRLITSSNLLGREMSIHHVVELISREEWNPQSSPSTTAKRLVSSNVVHILIYQTGNTNCFNMTSCSRMLKQMQVSSKQRNE